MGRPAKVTWDEQSVIDAVTDHLLSAGEQVGSDLAQRIGSRTPRSAGPGHLPGGGHAADATGHEVSEIPGGVRIRVGYEKRAFYRIFAEVGTSRQAASPVVLPTVLEAKNDILSGLSKG